MTNLRPVPRDQEAEALYWLDLANRVIGGEISPDEALQVLKSGDETVQRATPHSRVLGLTLQLHSLFEMGAARLGLVSSSPE